MAWLPLDWHCGFVAEIEKFPSSVLKHHYPTTPNYGDITKFQEWPEHAIDVLIGGTPCQSFSVAGLRAGLRDPRGNLALTFLAIAQRYRPRWILWENVPGVLSSESGRDFSSFLGGLAQCGYGWAYRVLDAQYFGLAQRRKRVFVVGHIGGQWQRAAAVLFERSCLRGDSAPSRETGQRTSPTLEGRAGRSGCNNFATSGGLAPTLPASGSIGFGVKDSGNDAEENLSPTLRAGGHSGSHANGGVMPAVAWALQERDSKGSDSSTKDGHLIPCEKQVSVFRTAGNCGPFEQDDKVAALNTQTDPNQNILMHRAAVRRLTPVECERLQGFPDNYTKISDKTADGPRYKALGNSMAVPVIRWLGERIQLVDSINP